MQAERIFLIGLSGGGKTTSGRVLAEHLGWEFADSDSLIEQRTGRRIPDLFREQGEEAFRRHEAAALAELSAREPIVVATGGGAPTTTASRRSLGSGFVVWLSVSPEEAARRLAADPATEDRPLLAGETRARLEALQQARLPLYQGADAALDVEGLTPDQVASEVALLWEDWKTARVATGERFYAHELALLSDRGVVPRFELVPSALVTTDRSSYPILVEEGLLAKLGPICAEVGLRGRAFIVTDDAVGPLFAERAAAALESGGFHAEWMEIRSGEEHKTLTTVQSIYDWLLEHRVERSDFVVCLGGGVVTDVGGFAAATCLRGIDFVNVPTSLLGMADASVGGKTGVDHPLGKNMIGAFAQPRAVVMDPELLSTLPERHLRNGWAELLKHGLILDAALVADLEFALLQGSPLTSTGLIARSVAIKAEVVSEDEREAGRRTLLNYGHTLGHAIEAVTGYSTYLHGEAIAIGMRAAGMMSVELGLLAPEDLARQQALLTGFGLPDAAPGLDVEAVLAATQQDKKVRAGAIRWVLLDGIGNAVTRDDVPPELVRRAAEAVLSDG